MGILISAFFIAKLIIEDDKDILILTDNNPIKGVACKPTEMKDPEFIPCVYSLWRENYSCQSTEELLEQKRRGRAYLLFDMLLLIIIKMQNFILEIEAT